MWSNRAKRKPWCIGLDVASDGIRMLQMRATESRLAICAGAQWRAINNGSPSSGLDPSEAAQAGREILRAGNFAGRRVVSSIGCDEIHIKTIRLPKMPPDEWRPAVMARAREEFDLDLSEVCLFAIRSGPVLQENDGTWEIILLAVPDNALRRRVELLEMMGLEVEALDTEPLALFRWFRGLFRRANDRQGPNAIINVSPTGCMVIVTQGENVLFIRNIERGGNRLTQAAAERLGLSFEDAARARREIMNECAGESRGTDTLRPPWVNPPRDESLLWAVHDAVRDEADELVMQIGLSLRYCSTTFGCRRIERAIMTGQDAWDPSLRYLLGERLAVRCQCAWPLRGMDVSQCPTFADRRGVMADWAICTGLASREKFNERARVENTIPTDLPDTARLEGV